MSTYIMGREREMADTRGILLVTVLVYGAIFFTLSSVLFGYIYTQSQLVTQRVAVEQAGAVAEAGLNYYKWFLAHYPDDITNGTGEPGPYVHPYSDPEGDVIGEFSLEIDSTSYCGDVASIEVRSTGHVYENATVSRTMAARYTRPTVAEYAYILNSSVWSGPDRVISGPYHSNGGIRMDSIHNSSVTSGQASWTCTSSFGCSSDQTVDGVYTTGNNATPALFAYPSSPVNFAGLTVDLSTMKDRAQNNGGLFFPRTNRSGYHVTFIGGNQVEVRRVNSKRNEPSGYAWGRYMNILQGTSLLGVYTINANCPVLYFEDQVWLDGVIGSKVAVGVAAINDASVEQSIILNDNITYSSPDASLLAVAEKDVLVGFVVPNNMEVNGIFVAQNGSFGRNHYDTTVPNAWHEYIFRNSLTINGSIVSNGRVGTQWVYANGNIASGFLNRYNSYDRNLAANPPPLTPKTSDVYEYVDWQDIR